MLARVLALVAGLLGVLLSARGLREDRVTLGLKRPASDLAGVPTDVAITQAALGSFRGIAVGWLWARTRRLRAEERFHEARTLADWITRLQPRFTSVWSFQAWNLSYNLSVTTRTHQERWAWVKAGLELLRSRGIPLNPDSPDLYRELSVIFSHKIGQYSDTAHWYYKRELAREMHWMLGPVPGTGGADFAARSAEIASAWEDVVAPALLAREEPLSRLERLEPETRAARDRLDALGVPVDRSLLERLSVALTIARSTEASVLGIRESETARTTNDALREFAGEPGFRRLIATLRAAAIHDELHMDPTWMHRLTTGEALFASPSSVEVDRRAAATSDPDSDRRSRNDRSGSVGDDLDPDPIPLPLDWRQPTSHALYWASLGARVERDASPAPVDRPLASDEWVRDTLLLLAQSGELIFDPLGDTYRQLVSAPFVEAFYLALVTEGDRRAGAVEPGARARLLLEHDAFLIWAVEALWLSGDVAAAERYYALLRQAEREAADSRADRVARYSRPLAEFVRAELVRPDALESIGHARAAIDGLTLRALEDGLANGRPRAAEALLSEARAVWSTYRRRTGGGSAEEREIVALPPFERMVDEVFGQYLLRSSGARDEILEKSRVWRSAPIGWRQRVFDRLRDPLYDLARSRGARPELAFPAPRRSRTPGHPGSTP